MDFRNHRWHHRDHAWQRGQCRADHVQRLCDRADRALVHAGNKGSPSAEVTNRPSIKGKAAQLKTLLPRRPVAACLGREQASLAKMASSAFERRKIIVDQRLSLPRAKSGTVRPLLAA